MTRGPTQWAHSWAWWSWSYDNVGTRWVPVQILHVDYLLLKNCYCYWLWKNCFFLLRKKTFTVLTLKWVSLLPVKAVKVKTLYDGDVHDVGLNKGPWAWVYLNISIFYNLKHKHHIIKLHLNSETSYKDIANHIRNNENVWERKRQADNHI